MKAFAGWVMKGRMQAVIAATVFAVLALLITPTVMLSESAIGNAQSLADQLREGTLNVPPPSEKVQGWPLIGERLYSAWDLAATNLGEAISRHKEQLTGLGKHLLAAAAGAGATVLQFVISIIIAGVLLVMAGAWIASRREG